MLFGPLSSFLSHKSRVSTKESGIEGRIMLKFTSSTIRLLWAVIMAACILDAADAGPAAYGICQTGCNALVVSCYAAAGFTFGTMTAGAGVPASIAACNSSLGFCMAACVAAGVAPTP